MNHSYIPYLCSQYHVYPEGDLREHRMSKDCWCKPTKDDEDWRVWVHHSMDGREAHENGRPKH